MSNDPMFFFTSHQSKHASYGIVCCLATSPWMTNLLVSLAYDREKPIGIMHAWEVWSCGSTFGEQRLVSLFQNSVVYGMFSSMFTICLTTNQRTMVTSLAKEVFGSVYMLLLPILLNKLWTECYEILWHIPTHMYITLARTLSQIFAHMCSFA